MQVVGTSSSSSGLLHELALPQVAAVLKITPAQLLADISALAGPASLAAEANLQLAGPSITLGQAEELLGLLGVNRASVDELVSRLLGAGAQTVEQLRATIAEILADLAADGRLAHLAEELNLPAPVVEALQLVPTTTEKTAEALNTTVDQLSEQLSAAGVTTQPFTAQAGLVMATLKEVLGGATTQVLAVPNGSGGVTLATVSSTPSSQSGAAAGAAKAVSNRFSVLSIKVTRSGLVVETVNLPGPGQLAVAGSVARKVQVRSKHGRPQARTRSAKVASVSGGQTAGTHKITLGPLKGLGNVKKYTLTLRTTFTPTGGSPNTVRRSVVVKRAANKTRKSRR